MRPHANNREPLRAIVIALLLASLALSGVSSDLDRIAASAAPTERITTHDNRTAAGTLAGGTLTIRLEARRGDWRPDRDSDPGISVKAFAVEGGPLQIPGPLIRVTEGTEIRAVVRNGLGGDDLVMHGLYTRPGNASTAAEGVSIPSGETREFRFLAGAPGTYYYWGATAAGTLLPQRAGADSQLSGAFIVDPRGSSRPNDRVLLMGYWSKLQQPGGQPLVPGNAYRFVINGRSWPHTERLAYRVGDVVRLRLINAGNNVHPMHLHGFYFNVDSRGDEVSNAVFPADGSPHMAVTERLVPGRTFTLTWKPTRPGNWLFHCHDNVHLEHGGRVDDGSQRALGAHHHVENHALEMMAGPVIGVTVAGKSLDLAESASHRRRRLQLVARVDTGGTDEDPAFGYTLHTGEATAPPPSPFLPGPTIVLKRGEPVSIAVVNQLPEPTAVHWHGIELESYYDGVAGYSGEGKRITPAIAPGRSFEARFTPPRSGTFIYHTHIDEVRQQRAGLSGALLVVDDPESYDPERDIVLLITVPRKRADAAVVLLNGSSTPAPRVMRAGQHHRLRFINVHTARPSMRMRLLRDSTLVTWRGIAKDGMDLPAGQVREGPSEVQMGNGETYDFDFVPPSTGEFRLEVTNAAGGVLVSMPIRVQ